MATGGKGMDSCREAHYASTSSLTMVCAVCLENHRRPVELPCYHTFCQKCLQDVAGSDPSFPCPSCRAEVTLPHGGVLALPVKNMEEIEKTDFSTKPADCNVLKDILRTMTVKPLLTSTMKGRILIAVLLLTSVGLAVCVGVCLGTGMMKVDPCDSQMWECETEINSETVATTALYQNFQDLPALQAQCRKMGGEIRRCVTEVQSVCSLTSGINTTVSTWQSAQDSMCGPGVICSFQVHSCIPSSAAVDEINNATQRNPPDVELVAEKCRALKESVGQCVNEVKADCSNVTSVSPTISSILSTLNSLCGAAALCNWEVQTCNPNSTVVTEINAAKQQSPPDVKLFTDKCRALKESVGQCVNEVKADCSNVTSVSPTISSIQSTLNSLCGAAAVCNLQALSCAPSNSAVTEINAAKEKMPPDVNLVTQKCRKMGGEIRRCVTEVQSVCSLTSGINTTVSTWQSAQDSMCGPGVICDFQVHSCIPSSAAVDEINNAAQRNPPDVELVAEKCRALKESVGQCVNEVKADCSNVTSVSPTISSIQSTLNSLCGAAALCNLEVQTCNPSSTAVTEINVAKQQSPPDVKLFTDKCRALKESVGQCVNEVKADCSNVTSVSPTISSIQSTLNSLCGAAAVCNLQALSCAPSNSAVTEINAAKEKMPPDVNLVTQKCRALKASVGQCVNGVEDKCSKVTRASSMVTYIESTANNLCGTEALCRLKMVSCKLSFDGIEFLKGKERIALLCRIQGTVDHCLYSEMGEECRTLPKINQDIDILTSTLASVQCSGGKRVMESFILILVMTAVTAWATTPFL